jgi:hypothetical protein
LYVSGVSESQKQAAEDLVKATKVGPVLGSVLVDEVLKGEKKRAFDEQRLLYLDGLPTVLAIRKGARGLERQEIYDSMKVLQTKGFKTVAVIVLHDARLGQDIFERGESELTVPFVLVRQNLISGKFDDSELTASLQTLRNILSVVCSKN